MRPGGRHTALPQSTLFTHTRVLWQGSSQVEKPGLQRSTIKRPLQTSVKSRDVINLTCLFVGRYSRDDEMNKRWPLDSQYESRIRRNFRQLSELIEADVFVNSLNSAACINILQKCDVDETRSKYDKARKLLDFLLKSSIANYEDFVECLKKTNLRHVAKILEERVGEWYEYTCGRKVLENKTWIIHICIGCRRRRSIYAYLQVANTVKRFRVR